MSARVFAQNRASSSSSRVPVAQVSGFAVIKVKYCCCLLPAPHTTGARRLVYVREASQGFPLVASSFGEFRSSEPEAVESYSTTTPVGGGLYARSLLMLVSSSESSTETPKYGLSQNGVEGWGGLLPQGGCNAYGLPNRAGNIH